MKKINENEKKNGKGNLYLSFINKKFSLELYFLFSS